MTDEVIDILRSELHSKQEQKKKILKIIENQQNRIHKNDLKIVKLSKQIHNIIMLMRERQQ